MSMRIGSIFGDLGLASKEEADRYLSLQGSCSIEDLDGDGLIDKFQSVLLDNSGLRKLVISYSLTRNSKDPITQMRPTTSIDLDVFSKLIIKNICVTDIDEDGDADIVIETLERGIGVLHNNLISQDKVQDSHPQQKNMISKSEPWC